MARIGGIGPVAVCIYLAVGAWGRLFAAVPIGIVVAVIAIRAGVGLIDRGISAMVN